MLGGGGRGGQGGPNFSLAVNSSDPHPKLVPNNYTFHIENCYFSKIKNRIEKYTSRNTFKLLGVSSIRFGRESMTRYSRAFIYFPKLSYFQ